MAYVRFLDNIGRVCQVNSPEESLIIILDEKEHEMLKNANPWQPLFIASRDLTEKELKDTESKLTSERNPIVINHHRKDKK